MNIFLPDIIKENGKLDLSNLPDTNWTYYISICGQDGSGKTSLRDNLAKYLEEKGHSVITSKSPCDRHLVNLLNNAISQDGYDDWYTEQLLFSFADGLLSNYMKQIDKHCDYFICQRGPSDQYDHGVTRSGLNYKEIHDIQHPERLAKFDVYIHMNCDANVAWQRICEDEGKDRYEYPEYFAEEVENTKKLYDDILKMEDESLSFLNGSEHFYLETTYMKIEDVFKIVVDMLKSANFI